MIFLEKEVDDLKGEVRVMKKTIEALQTKFGELEEKYRCFVLNNETRFSTSMFSPQNLPVDLRESPTPSVAVPNSPALGIDEPLDSPPPLPDPIYPVPL